MEALTLYDVPADVSALAEPSITPASQTAPPPNTAPDPPDEPPPELLQQLIPLTGCQDLEPGDVLGTASLPLLRAPLEVLTLYDVPADVSALAEPSITPASQTAPPPNTAPDPPDEPPPELLHRLDHNQHESFFRLWNTVPPLIRRIDFALDAAGWDSTGLDALSATLVTYAYVFSSSKLDYGECSLRPFEIKVSPGTQPIQSRPYRLNRVLSKHVDAILDSYLAAGLIQHSASPSLSPLVCVPKKSSGIRITVNYQNKQGHRDPSDCDPPRRRGADTLGGGSVFSVFDLFSGFTQLTIHPDTTPLTAFCTPNGLYEWLRMPQGAAGASAWFVSVMRLVTAGLDNIRMYLDDAIGSDDCPIRHVAALATFFARLRLHKLKLSPDKSWISAARVDFLGHVISADGVRPNDDRVAALTRMPMPKNIKQLRSLLGGLSFYRKFLSNMARHIRSITALLKKASRSISPPQWRISFVPFSRNSQHLQYLSSWTGTRSSTRLGPSASIAMPAPPASEPPLNKNNRMAPYAPSSTSAERPSTMSRTVSLWNSKSDASCGVIDASGVIYSACTSWSSSTISASSKSARQEKPNRASNAGWNFFRLITSASHIDEDKRTLTPTSSPACLSLPLTRIYLTPPP